MTLNCKAQHAELGFTLIEILVTVTVAGILLAIAVPSFQSFVQNDRDTAQANSLVQSLSYARSEAIKRGYGITVCPSAGGVACDAASTAWVNGWIVVDTNNADCGGVACPVLQGVPALAGSNSLVPAGNAATAITFQASGLVTPTGSPPLTVTICDTRGPAFARNVEVNATGRVAASQTPGLSVSNVALTCP